jgi:hypothetical protein
MTLSRALLFKCSLGLAGAALAASFIMREDEPQQAAGTERGAKPNPRAETKVERSGERASLNAPLDVSLLNRAPTSELEESVFAVAKPPPPPPPPPAPKTATVSAPPVAAEPPPKPSAPPLPFRFLGTMIDRGTTTLFVSQGNQNLSIRTGDAVAELYRLEQINDAGATFVYIPLQERQTLSMGKRN